MKVFFYGGAALANVALPLPIAGATGMDVDHAYAPVNTLHYPDNFPTTDLWVTTVHGSNTGDLKSQDYVNQIDNLLSLNSQQVTNFLNDAGYTFQTYALTGLGDTDLDLFYNHSFSDHWNGEIYGGVRLPTGAGDKYYGNPYKQHLGNGDHFELKVGGKVAWDTCNWLNVKADAHYNFVLEATEHRMAAYTGATIKNLGPKADADVSWGYFTGNIDFTLFHPKTRSIATTIGYELYYKTEDHITFKEKDQKNQWLGRAWGNTVTGAVAQIGAAAVNPGWVDLKMNLDSKVARKNTESIGHRAYIEGSYEFSKYLNMTVGGKYTFAGQNIPCEGEAYTGFNVKF